jgi:YgiT-type zinc finger domain-containing protein
MKCGICKQGETQDGKATITLEREGSILVIKSVPARICGTCGEQYVDEETTSQLLDIAEQAAQAGVQVEIREYAAA